MNAPLRVLVLGAGLVSRPLARFFLDDDRCHLTVASLIEGEARALIVDHPRGLARRLDVTDDAILGPLVGEADLVISLVPYAFHVNVARHAIRHRVNMVTASYVSPEMRGLDAEARAAGVTILNEVGLDPGLDHMSAMRLIATVRDSGARITGFRSCCGGLPAPEAAGNPWKYKFSWSPTGVLLAGTRPARYLNRGQIVDIPASRLFEHRQAFDVEDVGRFEIYPNRDSMPYIETYGLAGIETLQTMLRATVRYPGWSHTMQHLADLGLLDATERRWEAGTSYRDYLSGFVPGPGRLEDRLEQHLGLEKDDPLLEKLAWVGLLSDDPMPDGAGSSIDVLARRFSERMTYRSGERDMVVLRHEIVSEHDEHGRRRHVSLLVAYGEPGGDSAMARTVSLPAAVAGRLILEGRIRRPGVQVPAHGEFQEPILGELEDRGIAFREWSEPVPAATSDPFAPRDGST